MPISPDEDAIAFVMRMFAERGANAYHGESVTQLEHALQAAMHAENAHSSPSLIAAALLHDFGHLLYVGDEHAAERGIDDRHELFGAAWLERYFPPDVTEPIRLHVDAKRYLCAVEGTYFRQLSPASILSLQLQGGPLRDAELDAFRQNPHHESAVALRRWDELAKVVGLETPSLEHFRTYLEQSRR